MKRTYFAPDTIVMTMETPTLMATSYNRIKDPEDGSTVLTDKDTQTGDAGDAWAKDCDPWADDESWDMWE